MYFLIFQKCIKRAANLIAGISRAQGSRVVDQKGTSCLTCGMCSTASLFTISSFKPSQYGTAVQHGAHSRFNPIIQLCGGLLERYSLGRLKPPRDLQYCYTLYYFRPYQHRLLLLYRGIARGRSPSLTRQLSFAVGCQDQGFVRSFL